MSMIERVARAIAADLGMQDWGEPFKLDADLCLAYLDQGEVDFGRVARAAIEAMREPTDEMVADGSDIVQAWDATAETAWKAMIDAALK